MVRDPGGEPGDPARLLYVVQSVKALNACATLAALSASPSLGRDSMSDPPEIGDEAGA
jgi:hypothetical protein